MVGRKTQHRASKDSGTVSDGKYQSFKSPEEKREKGIEEIFEMIIVENVPERRKYNKTTYPRSSENLKYYKYQNK